LGKDRLSDKFFTFIHGYVKCVEITYSNTDYFSDISIDQVEYRKDSIGFKRLSLINGYYKLTPNGFQIYNKKEGTMYTEYYKCN
jgi:hypothetical protein